MYSVINDFSIKSRIMYNHANWFVRQCYIRERHWLRYQDMQKFLKHDKQYKDLMSQSSQCVLQVLERNWKSFFNSVKSYNKNPSKFLGEPKLPKYIRANGWIWLLKNNNTYIKDGRLYFRLRAMQGYSFKTSIPKEEVCNCFLWRQQDATRNSIQSVGQANFSHKELHKKSVKMIQEMLFIEKDINWNDYPTTNRRGSCCVRVDGQWIIDNEIPIFSQDRNYVEKYVNV